VKPGLPDGIFSKLKNPNSSKFWGALQRDMLVNLKAFLVYFTAVRYIVWPFGILCGHFWYIFPLLVCCAKKNLAALSVKPGERASMQRPINTLPIALARRGLHSGIVCVYGREIESRQGIGSS
jgi:hypothetical protein